MPAKASQPQSTPVRKPGEKYKQFSSPSGKPPAKDHRKDTNDEYISDSDIDIPTTTASIDHDLLIRSFERMLDVKMNQMKSDISATIASELGHVQRALEAHESRMSSFDNRISALEDSVKVLPKIPAEEGGTEMTSKLSQKVERISQQMDEDRARLTAVLHGIPANTDRSIIDRYAKSFEVAFRTLRTYTTKTDSYVGVLSFSSVEDRDSFIDRFRSKTLDLKVGSSMHKITISPGKTKLQRDRNRALRKRADDLSKLAKPGDHYSINWMTRSIELNGSVVCRQARNSTEVVDKTVA